MNVALLWVLLFGGAAAIVDARILRLPNSLTGLAYLGAALPSILDCVVGHNLASAVVPLAAGVVLAMSYLVVSILSRGGLGLGDVKLAAGIGTALGYLAFSTLLVATFTSTLSASIYAATRRITRKTPLREPTPFGPHMMLGYVLASLFSAS